MTVSLNRRNFIQTSTSLVAAALVPDRRPVGTQSAEPIRAVAFDGFALFDATTVVAAAEAAVPGRGREVVTAWRTQLFQYQWLRTLGDRYVDFEHTAADALDFVTKSMKLALSEASREQLLNAQFSLTAWPDARAAVDELHKAGLRLAFLSNMTERMLNDGSRRAGFRDQLEFVLSTDRVRAAKPDPRAYRMALDAFGLQRSQIAFVAFAGWDAAGASWFGYPTLWLNRAGAPAENLDASPELVGGSLADIVAFVKQAR